MMNLKTQLLSLGFSFVFGIFFILLVYTNYRFLFLSKKIIKILGSFLFVLDMSLLYFLIIMMINQGILHFYFLLMFFSGNYFGYLIFLSIHK